MSRKYDCFCTGTVIVNPQPLPFVRLETNDGSIAYRAIVERPLAPGNPVFALTISTKVPECDRKEAERQMECLTTELLADFLLAAQRGRGNNVSSESDSDLRDERSEVLVEPELVSTTLDGEYGMVFVVQAPIPPDPAKKFGGNVPLSAGVKHVYTAPDGQATYTQIHSNGGTEYIIPKVRDPQKSRRVHSLIASHSGTVTAKRVSIANHTDSTCYYTMTGTWCGP